jgi:hypothetical protein
MPVSQTVQQVIDQALASRDAARAADQQHQQALGDMERAEATEKQAALASVAAHKNALADMDSALTALRAELDAATGGGTPPAPTPPTPPQPPAP